MSNQEKNNDSFSENKANSPYKNAALLLGETVVTPGASLLVNGQYKSGLAHAAVGLLARFTLGLPGMVLVAASSFSKAVTDKSLLVSIKGDSVPSQFKDNSKIIEGEVIGGDVIDAEVVIEPENDVKTRTNLKDKPEAEEVDSETGKEGGKEAGKKAKKEAEKVKTAKEEPAVPKRKSRAKTATSKVTQAETTRAKTAKVKTTKTNKSPAKKTVRKNTELSTSKASNKDLPNTLDQDKT